MPEQPQWSERTLDMPPQDPWAEPPTAAVPQQPDQAPPRPPAQPFSRGVAAVRASPRTQAFTAAHEPTGTGWPDSGVPAPRRPLSWHVAQLRRGSEWSNAGLLFAFVCWGVWAISSSGSFGTKVIVLLLSLLVAVGVFALSRLVGRLVWERQLRRPRPTARPSHLVAGVFLVGVGFAHLRQTDWVMSAYHWVVDLL